MRRWALWAIFLASTSFAYILPAGSILRRVAARRDELPSSTVTVRGTALFLDEAAKEVATGLAVENEKAPLSTEVKLQMKLPGRCRLEVTSPESTKRLLYARNASRARVEGPAVAVLSEALSQVCAILALRSGAEDETRQALDKHLGALKVEYRKTSLARFGGQVTYVLGKTDDGAPQLWVYKDSFLPARIRYKDAAGAFWDVRLLGYGSVAAEDAFPRVLEVQKNGTSLFRMTVNDGVIGGALDEKLF